MKKLFFALVMSTALVSTSCETEATVDAATIQQIVDAAIAAALANYPDYPDTQAIADAAAAAATAAIASGLGDIDSAIQDALDAAAALTNPPIVRVGTGGVTEITSDTTWTNDKIWLMDGKVVVQDGATLTIEEGTIIKGSAGTGSNATVLIIAKGAKINAVGTAEKPIIFTDANDQIVYANGTTSPNRSATDKGLWGSVIILGKGIVGAANGEANIEGVVSGYEFTKYGGSNNADNSGIMKYVSIRHTGTAVSPGNELQGLTMGGVGSGTTIENIELIGSEDDGIEIFGGAVNVTNIVIANFDDDGIDLDQAYAGTISNAVVILGSGSDTAFEIDGTEEPNDAIVGEYTLQNVSVYGRADAAKFDTFGNWKSDATGFNDNVVFVDFPTGSTLGGIDADTYDGAGTAAVEGKLNFRDFVAVTSDSKTDVVAGQVEEASATWISVSSTRPTGKGADETVFAWTQFFN
jgi:hypothetical protein